MRCLSCHSEPQRRRGIPRITGGPRYARDDTLLVLLDHFRLDHVIFAVAALRRLGPTAPLRTAPTLRARLLVHHLGELVRRLGEILGGALDVVGAALLHRLARLADGALEIAHVRARDLVAVLVEHL